VLEPIETSTSRFVAMSLNRVREASELTDAERARIDKARRKAFILYEGKRVRHRSCGIALAETFNLPPAPYQALRRGGITGEGECGAIKAGELILGQYLGDPDPTGAVTPALRQALELYREAWTRRVDRGPSARSGGGPIRAEDIVCNRLTAPLGDFHGPERQAFCTNIAAEVASIVAEVLARCGCEVEIGEVEE
jgi:hypothetical protein